MPVVLALALAVAVPLTLYVQYDLGGAHEHLGNLDKADEYYKRIYETDIGFKDVSVYVM